MEIPSHAATTSIASAIPATEMAEAWFADVSHRLTQAKLQALLGVHYDADEFDTLVVEYRQAKRYAEFVRTLAAPFAGFATAAAATQPGLAA